MLLDAVLASKAFLPNATLFEPITLLNKAALPIAVLLAPVVLALKAPQPKAVEYDTVLFFKASKPTAVT